MANVDGEEIAAVLERVEQLERMLGSARAEAAAYRTGLGLATVYGIVQQAGGFIEVESAKGRGATFTIHLPLVAGAPDAPVRREAAPRRPTGRQTILVVEDEPAILQIAVRTLEELGYRVLAASTPGEAFRRACEHRGQLDLLLTDVILPEQNGRALANLVSTRHPDLRLLFMSGYTADVIEAHGATDDAVDLLAKPFTRQALAAKVREVLDRAPKAPAFG